MTLKTKCANHLAVMMTELTLLRSEDNLSNGHKRNTVEHPNNGHIGDEHFVHCSEVVSSSEVEIVWTL